MSLEKVSSLVATVVIMQGLLIAGCADSPCLSLSGAEVWKAEEDARLCVVGDLFVVARTPADFKRLSRIEDIEGSLVIYDNPELRDLSYFSSLSRIGGTLSISANANLSTIDDFPALGELAGAVYVGENPRLMVLELGGYFSAVDSVFVALNPKLHRLGGLDSLRITRGDFTIRDNYDLAVVAAQALESVGGSMLLSTLPALEKVDFPVLRNIGGSWSINESGKVVSLAGFSMLESIAGTAVISGNQGMTEIVIDGAFLSIKSITVASNPVLRRIVGGDSVRLNSSTSVTIMENPALETVEGFTGVTQMGGLVIAENLSLTLLKAWSELSDVSELPGLSIIRNASILGIEESLIKLRSVGDLWIFGNGSLDPSDVETFVSRTRVAHFPRIGDNYGESTSLNPCAWPNDGICDADLDEFGRLGTELCSEDPDDCGE